MPQTMFYILFSCKPFEIPFFIFNFAPQIQNFVENQNYYTNKQQLWQKSKI